MNWGLLIPIIAISCGPIAWVMTTWIRAKHGYPLEGKKGELVSRDGNLSINRENELLKQENERLNGKVDRLEERLSVLERIATDPAERTAREIEALR